MTDTQPKLPDNPENGTESKPQDKDSLQKQARHETSKVEGEDRTFDNDDGGRTSVEPSEPSQGDPQENLRGVGQERPS